MQFLLHAKNNTLMGHNDCNKIMYGRSRVNFHRSVTYHVPNRIWLDLVFDFNKRSGYKIINKNVCFELNSFDKDTFITDFKMINVN